MASFSSYSTDVSSERAVEKNPFPLIEECARLDEALRIDLEFLDRDVRCLCNRAIAGVHHSGGDSVLFSNAATTVLLSIAASLVKMSEECTGAAIDDAFFKAVAEDAIRWAKRDAPRKDNARRRRKQTT